MTGEKRVVFYARSAVGLGRLQRILILAAALRQRRPDVAAFVATGSAFAHWLPWPDGVDFVKLPSLEWSGDDAIGARAAALPVETVRALARDILAVTVEHLRPRVFVADAFPLEPDIVPILRRLRETRSAHTVLGLRDIVGEPALLRRTWGPDGVYQALDELYDRILVYGDRSVHDIVRESGMSATAGAKATYLGYVSRLPAGAPPPVRRRILVTVGAGRDGFLLLDAAATALRSVPDGLGHEWVLVTGPLMPAAERKRLAAEAPKGVGVVEFIPDLATEIASAAAVVAMGGYNTVTETLVARRPALIVPRAARRGEQLVRAQALAERGLVRMLHPDQLTPQRLLSEVRSLLEKPPLGASLPRLDGAKAFVDEILPLVDG